MWDLIVSVPDRCLSFYFLKDYKMLTLHLSDQKNLLSFDIMLLQI